MAWTTTDLVADIRRNGMIPTAASTGTADADILLQADNEMQTVLVPLVMSAQEEFFVRSVDVPTVAGQKSYRLPRKAMYNRLRSLERVIGGTRDRFGQIAIDQLDQYEANPTGTPQAFFLEAGSVNLVPTPTQVITLTMRYFSRPGRLVPATNASQIIAMVPSVTPGYTQITVSSTASLTATVDIIAANPTFEALVVDAPIINATGTTFDILTASLPPGQPKVGDWVTAQDTSPVPQIPVELHPILSERTVVRVLRSLGFLKEAAAVDKDCANLEDVAKMMTSQRVDGSPKKMFGGYLTQAGRNTSWTW